MVFLRKNKRFWGAAILFGTAAILLHNDAKAVGLTTELAAAVPVQSFSDVGGHWAETVIRKAADLNLVQGYSDGTFHPDGKITRAEFAAMLNRATKQKTDTAGAENPLSGLQNHWSQAEVNKLAALGFIDQSDYKTGFSPDLELTRYEMIKWISSGLAQSEPSFKQALEDTEGTLLPTPETYKGGISSEQIPSVALVKGTGIVDGFEDGTFRLAQATTRAEVSAILMRFMEVEGNKAEQYKGLNELREVGLTGSNLTTITKYKYGMDYNGVVRDFSFIRGISISLRDGIGTMKINRVIAVDSDNDSNVSIYKPMFLENVEKYQKNKYVVFSEIAVQSSVKNLTNLELGNSMGNGITSSTRLLGDNVIRFGLKTLSNRNNNELLNSGNDEFFWVSEVIPKTVPENYPKLSFSIKAQNDDLVRIILNK
ncbi:S-layer homology domain-containing protein [Paenibacillus chitinolyticus]|uniref:S-layer homology domain-containing protein n=1 Tax=Paenibacillus chitinolyticus TaxID=79263 RepID=A0A410X3J5_9BACL|nr:S-layer homology domain-containing protein [Paenibacillus chitinolyticus]MCY9594050.1 S-layer homology domain-containing protein [Paenibacillus chitinolyticus]MCY9595336.1 S-layer homology domain-containing protein [Paenibacillus chitinolyticus]QAV21192.1 S-layer homology domain-containing protein [Paenibacillus chitinolyticus]